MFPFSLHCWRKEIERTNAFHWFDHLEMKFSRPLSDVFFQSGRDFQHLIVMNDDNIFSL